jgi:hypothetical protein
VSRTVAGRFLPASRCTELGTHLEFIDIPRKNLTIVVNIEAVPPDELIYDLVTAIEDARWREGESP